MPDRTYERIFVVTHEGLGDIVFMTPTLRLLRANLPEARIRMKAVGLQMPLAAALGSTVEPWRAGNHEFVRLGLMVAGFRPDVYFDFDGSFRYAVLGRATGARRGIHPPREFVKPHAAKLHRETLPLNRGGHRVETLLAAIDLLGLARGPVSFEFDVGPRHRERAAALAGECIPPGSIALVPGSGARVKDWPPDTLQEVTNVLARDFRRTVVVVGRDAIPNLAHATQLAGRSDLLTDAYLLRYSGLFDVAVGVDTGMMQIAGSISSDERGGYEHAAGNRTVSLFGPTEAAVYRPYDPTGRFNVVVKPERPSTAMNDFGWAEDRRTRAYMREIDASAILQAIERQLGQSRRSTAS